MIMKAELLETTSVTVDPEWLKVVMKAELLETIAEIQSHVERELEWKLTEKKFPNYDGAMRLTREN